jgi:ElaA protein
VDVFVVEQNCPYPELDGRDLEPQTRHFWLESPTGAVISTLRLLEDHPEGGTVFRIGRVCTDAAERGCGHTARLMDAALAEVGEHPCRISAQTYLAQMYARHGFVADGQEFDEDGIAHVPMVRAGCR